MSVRSQIEHRSPFPRQSLFRLTGPQNQPIPLEQAKQHLRLGSADYETELDVGHKLESCIERVEKDCQVALITQTWRSHLFGFPPYSEGIFLDRQPAQRVDKIEYLAESTDTEYTELDSSRYYFDPPRQAVFPVGEGWTASASHPAAVKIDFTAGYGDTGASVPAELLEAALLLLTERFYHEDVGEQYRNLIKPYVWMGYPDP